MALLIHVGERSVFVVAGLFCLWLNYRLLGATSEFSKWSEQATSNVQSAIAILKLAITEAKQTLERISAAEKNARRERTDFTEAIEQIAGTKLEKIYQDIGSATTKARYEEDLMKRESEFLEKWKENLTTMLGEISTKIDKMG